MNGVARGAIKNVDLRNLLQPQKQGFHRCAVDDAVWVLNSLPLSVPQCLCGSNKRDAGLTAGVSLKKALAFDYFCKSCTRVPSSATLMVGFFPLSLNSIS